MTSPPGLDRKEIDHGNGNTGVEVTRPTDVGLKRELGLIGATWASETSIIGSGWLFGALFAAQAVGGAAVLAWAIAGVVVIVLALCHAELGAMYPVSGGTARFPHFAFGSVAGISFGFFSYVQAVTIAPIECFAFMQYASYFWPGLYNTTTKNVTRAGFVFTIVLMAVFVAVNFLAMRLFSRVNNAITWWKVAVPVLSIIVLLFKFHAGNFTAGVGFMPGGIKALFGALPAAGIIFAYSGFEQCDQLAGEIKNPGRNLPRAIIMSILIGTAIYILLQVAFIGAMPASEVAHGLRGYHQHGHPGRAVRRPGGPGRARLAGDHPADRRVRLPDRHRPDLHDRDVADRLRPGQEPVLPADLRQGRQEWHPVGRADLRVPDRAAVPAAVPELALAGRPDHRGERADVRRGAAVRGRVPRPGSRREPAVPDACAAVLAPAAFVVADLLIYWSGFEVVWKLGVVLVLGYVIMGVFMAFDPQRPPLDWKSAVWLPAWLIGMGIISWQGQYSGAASGDTHPLPPTNTFNIRFWWDIVAVAAFSLIIYFWAMRTKLSRDDMLVLVNKQRRRGRTAARHPALSPRQQCQSGPV